MLAKVWRVETIPGDSQTGPNLLMQRCAALAGSTVGTCYGCCCARRYQRRRKGDSTPSSDRARSDRSPCTRGMCVGDVGAHTSRHHRTASSTAAHGDAHTPKRLCTCGTCESTARGGTVAALAAAHNAQSHRTVRIARTALRAGTHLYRNSAHTDGVPCRARRSGCRRTLHSSFSSAHARISRRTHCRNVGCGRGGRFHSRRTVRSLSCACRERRCYGHDSRGKSVAGARARTATASTSGTSADACRAGRPPCRRTHRTSNAADHADRRRRRDTDGIASESHRARRTQRRGSRGSSEAACRARTCAPPETCLRQQLKSHHSTSSTWSA